MFRKKSEDVRIIKKWTAAIADAIQNVGDTDAIDTSDDVMRFLGVKRIKWREVNRHR